MSSESDPGNPVAGGVTRSIANGGVATGVAYGLGLSPQLSGAVGATVIAVSGAGEAAAVLNRRMRGSPGPKELALRSIILSYLSEMQKRLLESGKELFSNPSYAQRVREYADAVGSYDEELAAALLSLNGALVLNSDFGTANTEPVLFALYRSKELCEIALAESLERVHDQKGLWSRLFRR